jgi:hypothetical protein
MTNKKIQQTLIVVLILLMPSCAVPYRNVKLETFNYPASVSEDGIKFSYTYDVLRASYNNRYADKEMKQWMHLVAIQITNSSDSTIRLSRDYELYSENIKVLPMEEREIFHRLKQNVWPYYFYLFLTFATFDFTYTTPSQIKTTSLPLGLALGPGITLLNVLKATTANLELNKDLQAMDLWNTEIPAGERVYGLIGLEGRNFAPIHIRKKK